MLIIQPGRMGIAQARVIIFGVKSFSKDVNSLHLFSPLKLKTGIQLLVACPVSLEMSIY